MANPNVRDMLRTHHCALMRLYADWMPLRVSLWVSPTITP